MSISANQLERIWQELRLHGEWAEGFSLILLFAGNPQAVDELRQRLADSMQLQTRRLHILRPGTPEALKMIPEKLLTAGASGSGPHWLECWHDPADPTSEAWEAARAECLRTLNEKRFLLERDFRQVLILVLPFSARTAFSKEAPDLWVIRSYTAQLPAGVAPRELQAIVSSSLKERHLHPPIGSAISRAEQEWQRLWTLRMPDRLDSWDAFTATDAALARGDVAAAEGIAKQVLALLRDRRLRNGDTPQALRDLSVSLNNVGRVESDLGQLEAARAAYRESLELSRRLREALGDTPQALRDLSVSLNNVGRVESDLGQLEAARAAYRESLELHSILSQAFPQNPRFVAELQSVEMRLRAFGSDASSPLSTNPFADRT